MNSVNIVLNIRWMILAVLIMSPSLVWSQPGKQGARRADTTSASVNGSILSTDPIVIVRRYKPKLAESVKWQMLPDLPTMAGDSVPVRFEPLNLSSPPSWVPVPGSLPALPAAPPAASHRLWWEAGAGNLWGSHVAVDYRSVVGKKFDWGVFAEQDGARASVRTDGRSWDAARSSDALLRLDARTTLGRSTQIEAALFHDRRARSLFERDTTDTLSLRVGDNLLFQKWGGQTGFRSSLRKSSWWIGGKISGYALSDQWEQNERNLRLSTELEGKLGQGANKLELVLDITRFQDLIPESPDAGIGALRRVVWLRDRMRFQLRRWEMLAGFQLVVQGSDEVSTPMFFPHIEGALPSVNQKHRVFMGVTGDVERFSFDDLTRLNPFISRNPELRNTINRFETFAGARGQLGVGLHYRFRASVRRLDDALFIWNQTDAISMKPAYDATTELALSCGLEQVWGRSWKLTTGIDISRPKPDSLLQAWMTPTRKATTAVQWSPTEKLSIRVEWAYLNGVYVAQKPDARGIEYRQLPDFHNVNLNLTYQHRPGFDFFLRAGNLASVHYFRWFEYPTFGTQLLAGVRRTL